MVRGKLAYTNFVCLGVPLTSIARSHSLLKNASTLRDIYSFTLLMPQALVQTEGIKLSFFDAVNLYDRTAIDIDIDTRIDQQCS